jgi:dihydropteroate synthase
MRRARFQIQLPSGTLEAGHRTLVMGILNVTPDSFFDGHRYCRVEQAVERALRMEAEGADLIDVGAESTRPPHGEVLPEEEELRRLLPVLERLAGKIRVPLSVDTYKSRVAEAAFDRGVDLVNDISGLRFDRAMAEVVRRRRAAIILMHSRGRPEGLHSQPPLKNTWLSVRRGLALSLRKALHSGILRQKILLDPGLGFGKQAADNLMLLRRIDRLAKFRLPILVGASRKSFIGKALDLPVEERLVGSLACVAAAILRGAHIVRVHDVRESVQVARMCDAIS